jgi:hypothetical protein
MKRADERAMFAGWNEIYRQVREQKLLSGAAALVPADTSELHRTNVISKLAKDHTTARTITTALAQT